MTRALPAGLLDAFTATGTTGATLALLAQFDFDSQTIGMWTGLGSLTFNGVEFVGGGNLIGISPYQETEDLQAKGLTFQLSGVPLDLIAIAEEEPYQGRLVTLYIGLIELDAALLNETGGYLNLENGFKLKLESDVQVAYQLFSGLMDTMDITEDATSATLSVAAENVLLLLKRAKPRYYTSEDQKARYPDDTGLDFIAQLQDKDVIW